MPKRFKDLKSKQDVADKDKEREAIREMHNYLNKYVPPRLNKVKDADDEEKDHQTD
jgi:hypothetical protein